MKHTGPCWGGHVPEISCEEAERLRKEETQELFLCPNNSVTGKHGFMGDTLCMYGCGTSAQELFPDQFDSYDEDY